MVLLFARGNTLHRQRGSQIERIKRDSLSPIRLPTETLKHEDRLTYVGGVLPVESLPSVERPSSLISPLSGGLTAAPSSCCVVKKQPKEVACEINFNPTPRLQSVPKPYKKMSATTPTAGAKSFPFAIKCKLVKTVFTVPRKCSYCQKLIMFNGGLACQFCRFRCHKKCATSGGSRPTCDRPKLCSLSRLPSDVDDKVFEQVLRENEINANDMDAWLDEYCEVFSHTARSSRRCSNDLTGTAAVSLATSPSFATTATLFDSSSVTSAASSPLRFASSPIGSEFALQSPRPSFCSSTCESEAAAVPPATPVGDDKTKAMDGAGPQQPSVEVEVSVLDRFYRLLPWSAAKATPQSAKPDVVEGSAKSDVSSKRASLSLKFADLSTSSGFASPVRTPVDDYNQSLISELLHDRSGSFGFPPLALLPGHNSTSTNNNSRANAKNAFQFHRLLEPSHAAVADANNQAAAASAKVPFHKRMNWVRYIAGERGAYSQDRVTDLMSVFSGRGGHSSISNDISRGGRLDGQAAGKGDRANDGCNRDDYWPELTTANEKLLCATWPPSGFHMHFGDEILKKANVDEFDEDMGYADDLSADENGRPGEPCLLDLGEWHISYADLEFQECLLDGHNMRAYKGRFFGDVTIHTYRAEADSAELYKFIDDVKILMKIRHENIALFMGASIELPKLAVVTSVRKGDSLFDTLHLKKQRLSQQTKLQVAKQIAQGMGYLHAKGIILKTLRSKNIFLETKVKISMIDFAVLKRKEATCRSSACVAKGWLTYVCPELMTTLRLAPPCVETANCFTKESDIYAFGTILYELYAAEFPFPDSHAETIIWTIGNGKRQDLEALNCAVSLKSLIEDCWSCDPGYRPHFVSILSELQHTAALHRKHSCSVPDNLHKPKHCR